MVQMGFLVARNVRGAVVAAIWNAAVLGLWSVAIVAGGLVAKDLLG